MQYPIIDLITSAYINNGWIGLDIPQTITYEPIQLGSGTPSPDNVRPIEGTYILGVGTVYGGTLDVTTGVLTVDRAMADLGTWNWTMYNVPQGNLFRSPTVQNAELPYDGLNLLCSHYPIVKASMRTDNSVSVGSVGRIDVIDNSYEDVTSFKPAMSGVQLVYKLITPTTYQLTEEEVISVLGERNDISPRLKLPMIHYFPYPVIDSLKRASEGTMTNKDREILTHYLTPLGIGGI